MLFIQYFGESSTTGSSDHVLIVRIKLSILVEDTQGKSSTQLKYDPMPAMSPEQAAKTTFIGVVLGAAYTVGMCSVRNGSIRNLAFKSGGITGPTKKYR